MQRDVRAGFTAKLFIELKPAVLQVVSEQQNARPGNFWYATVVRHKGSAAVTYSCGELQRVDHPRCSEVDQEAADELLLGEFVSSHLSFIRMTIVLIITLFGTKI